MNAGLNRSQKGFTIIELLVVFSVISIIAGIGFVSFSSYNDSQRLTGSIRTFESFVDDAKNSAVSGVTPEITESGQNINCVQSISSYRINFCRQASNCETSGRDYEIVITCGQDIYVTRSGNFQDGVTYGALNQEDCEALVFTTLSGEVLLEPNGTNCQLSVTNGSDTKTYRIDNSANLNEI